MIDSPSRFEDDAWTVIWLFPGSELDMRGDRFRAVNKVKSVRIVLKGDALFPLFPREIKPKKLDTEPVRSQLRGDFLLGRDQAE
ncbi:hypothetical protein DY000_02047176 [Brassica cretica]|uniref:Plastid lipid-associated protein/fibrillin conserved domain-containing protein n=1 Tax=Brassica cretica TaxID=69181 RepID=A0ABQ7EZ70_BRACR|nr:hypothetical protein DY000_02047176 [Brassica cretica]